MSGLTIGRRVSRCDMHIAATMPATKTAKESHVPIYFQECSKAGPFPKETKM